MQREIDEHRPLCANEGDPATCVCQSPDWYNLLNPGFDGLEEIDQPQASEVASSSPRSICKDRP